MSQDLPYSAEYAKSDRASCKTCGSKIPKDALRVAKMIQSPHFDGKVALWNHFHCFFRKNKVKSTGDIKGFGTLRYEDQKKLTDKCGGIVSTGKDAAVSVEVDVEYAKSNRSTCKGCFIAIEKDTVRIGCWVEAEGKELKWAVNGKKQAWHHPACFVDCRDDLDIDKDITADMINGYKALEKQDQEELVALLGKGGMKKMKRKMKENRPTPTSNVSRSFEKKLQAQSNYLVEIRKSLKQIQNKYLREMLESNGYPTHGADIKLIDRCSDGIAFGRFCEPCSVCEETYFSIGDTHYICRGDVSEFTKCTNTIDKPKRAKWLIPESVKEQSDFLANLKLKTGTRIFNVAAPSTVETDGKTHTQPLEDYVFYSNVEYVDVKGEQKSVKEVVEKIGGGKIFKKFTAKCNAVITDNAQSGDKTLKRAVALEIPVVQCDKLVQGLLNKTISDISSVCFSGYEGDDYIKKRRSIKELKSAAKRERSGSDNKVAKKAKVTVQNGAEVFSETGLSGYKGVQVYKDMSGTVYACTLGMVDVSRGTNSYYKLQILKRGEYSYELFRAWGRIGTDIGGTKFEDFRSPNGAIEQFNVVYLDKTGNVWGDKFVKHAGKFHRMDLDYGAPEEDEESAIKPGTLTKLSLNLQNLIKLMFDVKMMKQALVEFEIDLNKMPLGKLSRNQIKEAFKVLSDAHTFISENNKVLIVDATNKFFTLIPHDLGMSAPPLLDNVQLINTKTKMLETLLELEIAYNMTKTEKSSKIDPIDLHYNKLNSDITVLDRQSDEFAVLQKYVDTTHAKTHTLYNLHILNIFKVDRHGEAATFEPYATMHNRKLLWHGSRISNFAGILSQGLRIAPPEAPVTGYMFGKGLYFADMVSKSANYCCTTPANNTGLLLLCEVALGDMYELTEAKYVERLPKGKHSTRGIGRTTVSGQHVLPNGCVMPLGPGEESDTDTTLLYNEYIVYKPHQVKVKYVFQMEFKYGKRQR